MRVQIRAVVVHPDRRDARLPLVHRGRRRAGAQERRGGGVRRRFAPHQRRHAHGGRVDYSVCVIVRDARRVVQCKPGRTTAHGVDRATFSESVNMHLGRWVVRFFDLGRTLTSWRFAVRPEGAWRGHGAPQRAVPDTRRRLRSR
jgi:hypothetical protein